MASLLRARSEIAASSGASSSSPQLQHGRSTPEHAHDIVRKLNWERALVQGKASPASPSQLKEGYGSTIREERGRV